jgi:hypothetical protein
LNEIKYQVLCAILVRLYRTRGLCSISPSLRSVVTWCNLQQLRLRHLLLDWVYNSL